MSNLEKFKTDLDSLIKEGEDLAKQDNEDFESFKDGYEIWYSEAENVIKIILPGRHNDFVSYYENKKGDGIKKQINYLPKHYIGDWEDEGEGYWAEPSNIELTLIIFKQQLAILKSVKKRFKSSLFDIEQVLQADLFDSEIEISKELNKKGFFRAAGAISGVVLEGHLKQICKNHNIAIHKNKSTLNPITNELLKDVLDVSQRKNIDYLASIRNKCDHKDIQSGEPAKEEVEELITGTNKIIHTIF